MTRRFLVVGAGFSGAVLARELVQLLDCSVDVVEARDHIAGNCHTERDLKTGVMVHVYGPHTFHTSKREIWDYVSKYGQFRPFINRIKAVTPGGIYSLPINLLTINSLFGKQMCPSEAHRFLQQLGDSRIKDPANFEEYALSALGEKIYREFFYGYTKKQWGVEPKELPASILKRLPIRFSYDDNYYTSLYQGIPVEGYTNLVGNLLRHERIKVFLSTPFGSELRSKYDHLFYTGTLDGFYQYRFGALGYRTVTFERMDAAGDYQGNAIINYTDEKIPYTRVHEHKHFTPWETHEKTVAFREYSKETTLDDTPFYPKRLSKDKEKLALYVGEAYKDAGVSFLGRLGTYRYLDMHQVIDEAIHFSQSVAKSFVEKTKIPVFPIDLPKVV